MDRLAFVMNDVLLIFAIIHDRKEQLVFMKNAVWITSRRHENGIWPSCKCVGPVQESME